VYILNAHRSIEFFYREILGVQDFFAIECVDVAYINTYSCEGVAAKEGLFIGAATHMQSFSLEQETSMYVLAVLASFRMTKVYATEAEG
jgi:hypothetical protein